MKTDKYVKVSAKWWHEIETGKWIHNDNIDFYLFSGLKKGGTNLGKEFKNKRFKKFY